MAHSDTYLHVLTSYEVNPKVQILRKIKGKQSLKIFAAFANAPADWLADWTDSEKKTAKGFIYVRRLRTTVKYGIKLVATHGGNDVVLGHEDTKKYL